jgi:TIR domain
MAGQNDQAKPISLFYSYSHKDENLRRKLETHLAALRRSELIAEWHDRKLEPGDAWKGEIDHYVTTADIILLLVSADFINSDYCWGEEMAKALARHHRGEARMIPVILRYCHWQSTPLGRLQAAPKDGKPIMSWSDRDKAFHDVVAAIERAAHSVRATPARNPAAAGSKPRETARTTEPPAAQTPSEPIAAIPAARHRLPRHRRALVPGAGGDPAGGVPDGLAR